MTCSYPTALWLRHCAAASGGPTAGSAGATPNESDVPLPPPQLNILHHIRVHAVEYLPVVLKDNSFAPPVAAPGTDVYIAAIDSAAAALMSVDRRRPFDVVVRQKDVILTPICRRL